MSEWSVTNVNDCTSILPSVTQWPGNDGATEGQVPMSKGPEHQHTRQHHYCAHLADGGLVPHTDKQVGCLEVKVNDVLAVQIVHALAYTHAHTQL